MGSFYEMQCSKCGVIFTHDEGYGLTQPCICCSAPLPDGSTIICPNCHNQTRPDSDEFNSQLRATILWD